MDLLELSLKAHLPFIAVKTDDLLHVQEVLEYIAGEAVGPYQKTEDFTGSMTSEIAYTADAGLAVPEMYLAFKAAKKTLVFVNCKPSVMFFDCGQLMPPQAMMLEYLSDLMEDPLNAESVLPAFGGMTLKEMFEACKLTLKDAGVITAASINNTRNSYISKLKGISQIATEYPFYSCPSYLSTWLDKNGKFFLNPVLPEMTPRGLMFDGPPGTGKTMAAKYIAKTLGVPLYHLDVGGAKGKYVGDSEGNLAAALAQVDKVAPCVVLIDEVEKIFSSQGDQGVTTSMLGSLLWWLQEHKSQVFVVMTTNNKAAIPPELYRPGRIDKVMTFNGLNSPTEMLEFATQAFTSLSSRIWPNAKVDVAGHMKKLAPSLKTMPSPFPQVAISQAVLEYTKGIL